MSGDGGDLDRNEAATAYKLQKAHERGSIVKSAEVTFAALLLAACASVYGLGDGVVQQAGGLMAKGISASGRGSLNPQSAMALAAALSALAAQLLAPLLFVFWTVATLSGALQARGAFSAQPLKPDFSRLSPAKGLERLMSAKSLLDLLRNAIKLTVMAVAGVVWGNNHLTDLIALQSVTSRSQANGTLDLIGSLLGMATALFLLFAMLDWMVNRWEFARQMRMSKRDVKDEHKEREGDPRIKSRLRELRMEWLKRARSLAKVKSADVLLTNPTHYAVALQYRHGEMPAPKVLARGAGEMALRMREEARRRQVPVVENPPLARALFRIRGNEPFVPEEHFHDVARILRWVYAARRQRTGTAA